MLGGAQASALKDKRIRIITVSEIRYEGTLYQINKKDKTIALKNVVAFGTEDRRVDQVIPPSQNVYELIIFKASHIKDITVLSQEEENKTQVAQAQNSGKGDQPAEPSNARVDSQEGKKGSELKSPRASKEEEYREKSKREPEEEEELEYQPKGTSKATGGNNEEDYHQERHYSGGRRGGRGGYDNDRPERKDKGLKEFDFDEMIEKNNLLEKEKTEKEEKGDHVEDHKYDQDAFFDNLSTSINEKGEGGRKDPYHQFKTNNETFGYQKRPNHHRGGRFHHGGGGGGYGRGGNYRGGGGKPYYNDGYGQQGYSGGGGQGYRREGGYQGDGDRYYNSSRGSGRGGRGGGRGGRGGYQDNYDNQY